MTADTIIVAANADSFNQVFLGENCWYPVRLGDGKPETLQWIAVYQTSPISAITHYARLKRIEIIGMDGRYKLVFDETSKFSPSINWGNTNSSGIQGQRYTMISKLLKAKTIDDLKPWD